jgi:hypothetical protein
VQQPSTCGARVSLAVSPDPPRHTSSLSVVMGLATHPGARNGSAVVPLGRPLLRGGGERRVDRISDLRVCSGHGSFST